MLMQVSQPYSYSGGLSSLGHGTFLTARTQLHVVSLLAHSRRGLHYGEPPAVLADLAPVTGMDPQVICAETLADHREY